MKTANKNLIMPKQNLIKHTLIILLLLLSNCGKNYNVNRDEIAKKTVLIYLSANNNLKKEAISTIMKIQKGLTGFEGTILVYVKTENQLSYLIKIKHSVEDRLVSDTLITYQSGNSSNPNFLKKVINDSRKVAPAYSYGLILWSHATSWLPAIKTISTKSFGIDNGIEMNISDLKDALPNDFEFILFDACYMGSIEVLYELRNKTKYFLSSPTEVLASGFPYEECTKFFFNGLEGLKEVSNRYINYYKNKDGAYSSATISLLDATKLEKIAIATKNILKKRKYSIRNLDNIQRLNFQVGTDMISSFDFLDFFTKNFSDDELKELNIALQDAIIFKANTNTFLNQKIISFSGLGIYIPSTAKDSYITIYKYLEWEKDSNWISNFLN